MQLCPSICIFMRMRIRFRSLIFILVSLIAISCSKSDMVMVMDRELVYEMEWAEAYLVQNDEEGGEECFYRLVMFYGRMDEDLNLISTGAKVSIALKAPENESVTLPEGRYGRSYSYTLYCGTDTLTDETELMKYSYIELRWGSGDETSHYPVLDGMLEVEVNDKGDYEIEASIVVAGGNYEFEFEGFMETYDCRDLDQMGMYWF